MSGKLEFELRFGKRKPVATRDRKFRILIMADLAGEQPRPQPLADRSTQRLGIDNFDALMRRISPTVQFPARGLPPLCLQRLDDFHPDSLFRHSASCAALRLQREALQDPARFEAMASELGLAGDSTPLPAVPESDASMLNRLLGKSAAQTSLTAGGLVDRLVKDILPATGVVDERGRRQRGLAEFDARIAVQMRHILHNPVFRALESAWRGLWQTVSELDACDALEIHILDLSRSELEADLLDNDSQGLRGALSTSSTEDGPWSILGADFDFAADAADLGMLAGLAWLAREHDAPLLAAARPALVGCSTAAQLADPKQWQALPAPLAQAWQALRQRPEAAWLGLVMPRLLGRLPYGKAADPVNAFAFEEIQGAGQHDDFLWDNPIHALLRLLGEAYADEGWEMNPAAHLEVGPLPGYVYRTASGESRLKSCTEVILPDTAATALLARGIMPMLGLRNGDAARLLRWQSMASPASPLAGVLGN